ncbi:MAG: hypothetical protein QM537_01710 [Candidatus Symbiobacter sp.]|nr:hypothetical protein [Candidatus Symbiobacter sp.]
MSENQTDDNFVQFNSPQAGLLAAAKNLYNYQMGGINRNTPATTIAEIITRQADPAHNDTQKYIDTVVDRYNKAMNPFGDPSYVKIDSNTPLFGTNASPNGPNSNVMSNQSMAALMEAMINFEGGGSGDYFTPNMTSDAIQAAKEYVSANSLKNYKVPLVDAPNNYPPSTAELTGQVGTNLTSPQSLGKKNPLDDDPYLFLRNLYSRFLSP